MVEKRLSVSQLTFGKGLKSWLQDITFDLSEREILCVVGPSGSGQDFFLRGLMGDIKQLDMTGVVQLGENDKFGYVSRSLSCIQHLSVFQNLSLVLNFIGIESRTHLGEAVEASLKAVNLWGEVKSHLHRPVHELSHFQQLRLNLARTLILRPTVLLLDDPTLELDVIEKNHYEQIIYQLRESVSVVWVTNDIEQAGRVSDKLMFLKNGKIIECGWTEDLFTLPQNSETEFFLSRRFYV